MQTKRRPPTLRQQTQMLAERVKELHCLYAISKTIDKHERGLAEVLAEVVEIVPRAWLHTEVAGARISVGTIEVRSAGFNQPVTTQRAPIIAKGKVVGEVMVGYLEERPTLDEGPFLQEERHLLNAIAQRLGEIVEHKRAERELSDHRARLSSLTRELLRSEEAERRRIARDLHDRIGQTLATLRIRLGMLRDDIPTGPAKDSLSELSNLLKTAVAETRSLIFDLSPPVLHEFGLAAALEWLTEEIQRSYGLKVDFHCERTEANADLPDELKSALFRAARELISNVARHAGVTEAQMTLVEGEHEIVLHVEDCGVGFDPRFRGLLAPGGFGLFGLRERLEQLGGRVQIHSAPNQGTRVTIASPTAPLKRGGEE